MAKRSLKALKEQLKNQERSGGNSSAGAYYPFWRLPFDGKTSIRVLEDPDEENPLIVYLDYKEHALHIGDEVVRVPCPKTVSQNAPCPICELSAKLYKANNEERGKYFYRDAYVLLRGLITKDGMEYEDDDDTAVGEVKAFKLSFQLAQKFKSEIGKLDDEDFWDLEEGLDFIIEKQKQVTGDREYGKYDLGSGFARKNTSIPDDWAENISDEPLSALIGEIPSYDELAELLQKHLRDVSGGASDDDDDDDATETEDDLKEKLNRNKSKKDKKKKKKEEAEEVVAEEPEVALDDDDDDDDDDLLAMLDDD